MHSRRPVTDKDYAQVKALHAEGLTRNEIARQMRRSGKTVSRIAEMLGLDFDRTRTAVATEARKVDARAKRTALAEALLDDAERLRQQLFAPALAWNFGGKDNTYEQQQIPQPSFRDQYQIMSAIGVAVDRHLRLDDHDAGDSAQVVGLLTKLFGDLQARHGDGTDA